MRHLFGAILVLWIGAGSCSPELAKVGPGADAARPVAADGGSPSFNTNLDQGALTPGKTRCSPSDVKPVGDCTAIGIRFGADFARSYSCFDLGTSTSIRAPWGGLASRPSDPEALLITGG